MATIINYSTKQRGYGRQSLYVDVLTDFDITVKDVYVKDVFPNVQEHFGYTLSEHASYNEETDTYFDHTGENIEESDIFETNLEAVQHFVNVDDLELPGFYVIAWEQNTNVIKYHNDDEKNGVNLLENATIYESEDVAQSVIDDNEWVNCYVKSI